MLASVHYRLRQFVVALGAHLSPAEQVLVAQTLSPAELHLFAQMPRYGQRHCLNVFATLRAAGHADPLLLRAALLHDCGKLDDTGRPLPLLYYGVFVVLLRLAPGIYDWAAQYGRGPLRWFAIHAAHDERSAAMAARAGSPPALVTILHDYGQRRETPQTLALGWADRQH